MKTESMEEMYKIWTESQEKMWSNFFKTTQDFGKSPSVKAWEQTVSIGEEALKNTVKSQSEFLKNWVEGLSAIEGMPAQALESAKQFQEMTGRWSESQLQIWTMWFDMLKKFDPTKVAGVWAGMPQNPFQMWQEATQKIMETQMEMMNSWMKQMRKQADE